MRKALAGLTTMAMACTAIPALAQTEPIENRVNRIEKELRAVQRKVFPTGVPIQPENVPATSAATVPASTPVTDLMARVDALETQLATLTGQVEQSNYKLRQLQDDFAKYKAQMDARLGPAPVVEPSAAAPAPASTTAPASAKPAAAVATPKPAPATSSPASATAARKAAVAAIERPSTGNAADDEYSYGYRLWNAGFFPEAQAQLKATVEKYGSSSLGSRMQNLLGRAYLDDGKPALASVAFYENYQSRPNGDRAADSLTYLGESLLQLKKTADACKVYQELEQTYGENLRAELRTMMEKGRARGKCAT